MSKPSIYLAGPITGSSFGEANEWRAFVKHQMDPDIDCFSPLRAKPWLLEKTNIADAYSEYVLSSQRGIMVRDYTDCQQRDLIFVNVLGAVKPSLGTVMEIAWGYAFRKPIVVVMEKSGNPHDHAMIREADILRVETIEEGIQITRALLLPS